VAKINKNFQSLKESYLFTEMGNRIAAYAQEHPEARIIRMGIGDVTLPLPQITIDAMKKAADEQADASTFRGYGPEQGYDFLRNAIKEYYGRLGVDVALDEVFVNEGAKSDVGNVTDIFALDNVVLIPDPVYPVYVDTNIMSGREIKYVDCTRENDFAPLPPDYPADLVYLCSPNNPTGAAFTREQLEAWVNYANVNGAVLLYDAAYEAFIDDPALPRSIFEIPGAETCAIEFCSLSKTAGFTGTRCGYSVIPHALTVDSVSVNKLWLRRQTTKFNGVPYVIQRAAEAAFSTEGVTQCKQNISHYKENARVMADTLDALGIYYTGGVNSPYIWMACPDNMSSWDFFDFLLNQCGVVGTPGEGFGKNGEGYFRLSAFGTRENTIEAMDRLKKALSK